MNYRKLIASERAQYKIFAFLFLLVIGMTLILSFSDPLLYQRFIGKMNPLFAILLSGIIGFLLLSFFLSKGWFVIHEKGNLKRSLHYLSLVMLFVATAIFVDWKIVYPKDINVLYPKSLLFYPSIAFLVEILFHVVPLSLLLFGLTTIHKNINYEKVLWGSIIIVATLEPTYQALFMKSFPEWAIAATWINLFLFNITQLFVFTRFGFITMYSFRIVYYLFWHIIWGYFRLGVLF